MAGSKQGAPSESEEVDEMDVTFIVVQSFSSVEKSELNVLPAVGCGVRSKRLLGAAISRSRVEKESLESKELRD